MAILIVTSLLNRTVLKRAYVSNDGYNYSFLYYSDAKKGNRYGYNQLSGDAKNPIITLGLESQWQSNCLQGNKNNSVYFYVYIQRERVPVCYEGNKASIVTSFDYDGNWQQIIMYNMDLGTPINPKTASTIIESVYITKQSS